MGADMKQLRLRIRSVDSTRHLTRAMGLVAASRIRRASEVMNQSRRYVQALEDVMDALAACPECRKSTWLRPAGDRTRLIVIAGDRGMAGGYNANIFRMVREYPEADLIPIGKRACDRFGSDTPVWAEKFPLEEAQRMAKTLCQDFAAGAYDRLGIVCTRYVSVLTQEARLLWVLPLEPRIREREPDILFEPDAESVLAGAVETWVAGMIAAAVRESYACENAARRAASDSAGRNADQMIDKLTIAYNRARQSAITQEITEIVAGAGR